VFVLEVAARPIGGLCARSLKFELLTARLELDDAIATVLLAPGTIDGTPDVSTHHPSSSVSTQSGNDSSMAQTTDSTVVSDSSRTVVTIAGSRVVSDSSRTAPVCSLEELLLRQALGESPEGWRRESRASGVMMIPIPARGVYRGVAGVEEARMVDGVEDVTITAKPDQLLVPLPEGASYLGFIFSAGETNTAVVQSLRAAHARLRFAVEPELRVLQSANGAM
jgi:hypothetical protein